MPRPHHQMPRPHHQWPRRLLRMLEEIHLMPRRSHQAPRDLGLKNRHVAREPSRDPGLPSQAFGPRLGQTRPGRDWRCLLRQPVVPTSRLSLPSGRALSRALRTSRAGRLMTSPAGRRCPDRAPSRTIVEQPCRLAPLAGSALGEGAGSAEFVAEAEANPHELLAETPPRAIRTQAKLLQKRDQSRLIGTLRVHQHSRSQLAGRPRTRSSHYRV
jgi:hypothetical protein